MAEFADCYTKESGKGMGDCEELQINIERLSGQMRKRQENFRIKVCKIINMRESRPNFTDDIIDSDLFTTNLERHFRIITNRSTKT